MAVTLTKYEQDNGNIARIRLDSDFAADAGTAPAGAITPGIPSVRVSRTRRQTGVKPRGWVLDRVRGTAPNQFRSYTFLPKLTPAAYNAAPPATIDIGGTEWTFLRREPESVR